MTQAIFFSIIIGISILGILFTEHEDTIGLPHITFILGVCCLFI